MQLTTKYFDDEDEERRFELEQMARFSGGGGPAADPIHESLAMYDQSPPEPDAERAAPILEGRDPSQMQRGPSARELEDDAIRAVRDSYGQKESMFEQGAPTAIAAVVDQLVNKGRGLGAIVGGYAQGRQRKDAEDRSSMRELAQLEIMRSRENATDKYREQQNALGGRNADLREGELAEMRARRLKEGVGLNDLQKSQANLAESQAYRNWTGQEDQITPYQRESLDAQKAYRGEMNADRDAARTAHAEEFRQRGLDRQTQQDAANQVRLDREARQADKDYQDRSNKFRDETEKTRPQLQRMKQMDDIMNKPQYKDDIPGIGAGSYIPGWVPDALRGGSENASDARTMQSASADMADLLGRQRSGAAIPPAEYAKMQTFITAGEHATDQQFKDAYSAYHKVLSSEFMNQVSGREQNARDVMRADGGGMVNYMNMGEYEPPAPPPQSTMAPPVGGGRVTGPVNPNYGLQDGDPARLKTTDQPRGQVPQVNDYLEELKRKTRTPGVVYRP